MKVEPPTDTIFEREPLNPPLEPKVLLFFKLLMLALGKSYQLDKIMTPTQLIDAMESCRRKGLVKIYQNDQGEFSARLTPTGSTTAFLSKLETK